MKLASHNSMTYLPPKKWYLYPFRFIARCQSKSIVEQYEHYNIRMFDLRIAFDKDGDPEFRHGLIAYKGDVYKTLQYLNSKKDVSVRILLEKGNKLHEVLFTLALADWQREYPNIKFFGGVKKKTWEPIILLPEGPTYEDKYSSCNTNYTTGSIWDDWFPWLYAKFNNKKNIKKGTDKEYLMIDFVNIQ